MIAQQVHQFSVSSSPFLSPRMFLNTCRAESAVSDVARRGSIDRIVTARNETESNRNKSRKLNDGDLLARLHHAVGKPWRRMRRRRAGMDRPETRDMSEFTHQAKDAENVSMQRWTQSALTIAGKIVHVSVCWIKHDNKGLRTRNRPFLSAGPRSSFRNF